MNVIVVSAEELTRPTPETNKRSGLVAAMMGTAATSGYTLGVYLARTVPRSQRSSLLLCLRLFVLCTGNKYDNLLKMFVFIIQFTYHKFPF